MTSLIEAAATSEVRRWVAVTLRDGRQWVSKRSCSRGTKCSFKHDEKKEKVTSLNVLLGRDHQSHEANQVLQREEDRLKEKMANADLMKVSILFQKNQCQEGDKWQR